MVRVWVGEGAVRVWVGEGMVRVWVSEGVVMVWVGEGVGVWSKVTCVAVQAFLVMFSIDLRQYD